ncbi:hypothetical protein EYF80_001122 [Liparis tanakae]|uniref:Uncharacterized protein n=1 Tax=Liparis tanakae TaxID=230148 RepID=A0A4Z2JF38_9TELE|nr:hypothetical protein EYF80_001122 [Liparis tanakae]
MGVDGATQREMELVSDRREAKYIVQVVEGCCQVYLTRDELIVMRVENTCFLRCEVHISVHQLVPDTSPYSVPAQRQNKPFCLVQLTLRQNNGGTTCVLLESGLGSLVLGAQTPEDGTTGGRSFCDWTSS